MAIAYWLSAIGNQNESRHRDQRCVGADVRRPIANLKLAILCRPAVPADDLISANAPAGTSLPLRRREELVELVNAGLHLRLGGPTGGLNPLRRCLFLGQNHPGRRWTVKTPLRFGKESFRSLGCRFHLQQCRLPTLKSPFRLLKHSFRLLKCPFQTLKSLFRLLKYSFQ